MDQRIRFAKFFSLFLATGLSLAPLAGAQGGRRESPKPAPATAPPPGPVHCIGEWEEAEGVLMLWRNADLIKKLSADLPVYIPVGDAKTKASWEEFLAENEVPMDNITFMDIDANRIYTRDFGPFFVWDGNNEIGVVDYQYGRDSASERFNKNFTDLFGINYYYSGIRHVGGNYLPNAYETSFSSTHLYEQNPDLTRPEIAEVMETFYGVKNYPLLSPKTIWHHDTWGKPTSPDTLIVVDFPEDNAYKHAAANDTVDFYETLMSPWGTPYEIHRLPMFEKERSTRWEPQEPSVFNAPSSGYGFGGGFWSPPTPPAPKPKPAAKPGEGDAKKPAEKGDAKKPAAAGEKPAGDAVFAEAYPTGAAALNGESKPSETPATEKPKKDDKADGATAKPKDKPDAAKPDSDKPDVRDEEEERASIVDPNFSDDLNWNSERGTSYRPYMNSLVSNGRVYVPVDDCEDDEVALAVFQKAFPGYEIVGVDSGGTYSSDSLHCRTRNFMRRDPIRIYPMPAHDTEDTEEGYLVTAEVIAPNGSKLSEGQPSIRWSTTGEAPFEVLAMEATDAPGHFKALLPAQEQGTTISYYIEATDDGERTAVYPPVAPKGLLSFDIRRDRSRPEVSRFQPTRVSSIQGGAIPIRMLAKDDMTTPTVRVEYEINGEKQEDVTLTRTERTYWFNGELAAKTQPGDVVSYRVIASDGSKANNQATLPRFGKVYCPIVETAEVGVVDMTQRSGAGAFIAQALGDLEVTAASYNEWPSSWDAHDIWFVCLGVFADNHVLTAEQATDLTAALKRGKNIYIEGGDTWCHDPESDTIDPMFGVKKLERGRGFEDLVGEPRSIVSGLTLEYVGENLFTDRIGAIEPASLLFTSHEWNRGRTVLNQTDEYRTIASTFTLAGLLDAEWPSNRKEILVRYLEFLGDRKVTLRTAGTAKRGATVPVRIEGKSGDRYILFASRSEFYNEMPGYGTLRLDPANMYTLAEGRIPRSGVVRFKLEVPDDATTTNSEIHCQALVGKQLEPGSATFTNRDILKVVN